ncbi:MAG: cell division protein FtsZ [bacterium]
MVRRIFLNPDTPGGGEELPKRPRTVREIIESSPDRASKSPPGNDVQEPEEIQGKLRFLIEDRMPDVRTDTPKTYARLVEEMMEEEEVLQAPVDFGDSGVLDLSGAPRALEDERLSMTSRSDAPLDRLTPPDLGPEEPAEDDETEEKKAAEKEEESMSGKKQDNALRFGFQEEQRARLNVIGIGGAGSNAVENMILSKLTGVEFVAVNTDLQALDKSSAQRKIQIGRELTRGLGAGGNPEIGRKSAEEDIQEIKQLLNDTDMAFVTCGMGGGTGTGAAPIIAQVARDLGILTVGIVTKPFTFEGKRRTLRAIEGTSELKLCVDTLIVIPNDKLIKIADKNTTLLDSFRMADNVLYQATKGISDIINTQGYINVDFADVKSVMRNGGDALMGIGVGEGEDRAIQAADMAISSPLLDNMSIEGAQGLLINITAGSNVGMLELQAAVTHITEQAGNDSEVIFGFVTDDTMDDKVMVTVIATGFNVDEDQAPMRVAEERMQPQVQEASGRTVTRITSVRGAMNGGNGKANGKGHANGNGNANGNGSAELRKEDLIAVNAELDEIMDSYVDLKNMNDRDLPAFLRRHRSGGK